jgi:tRNA-specific 2-thiouridylase
MQKVVIALSGGVDSSVAAALLVDQGYDVVGVTMRLWSEPGCEHENRCCTPETRLLAQQLAEKLNIPFHVLDTAEIFREQVVQAFLDGYANGDTPNPCIFCNRRIKWGFLLDFARSLGAEWIATGHYGRIVHNDRGIFELWKGVDESKDQSYFLSLLTQQHLAHTIFPLAEMHKTQVRALAQQRHLPAADQAESQDLCFLSGGDYRAFLRKYVPQVAQPGAVVNRAGRVLGEHQGLAFYTIGQRKGLPAAGRPLYVLYKNLENNTLLVGYEEELGQQTLHAEEINWIAGEPPLRPLQAQVKIRYRAVPAPALVTPQPDGGAQVVFEKPLRDITPGQMAVFYAGNQVLGGGLIR